MMRGYLFFWNRYSSIGKRPESEDAQELAYKKVSKEDLVNGALSFRLKSDLLENLYVTVKMANCM